MNKAAEIRVSKLMGSPFFARSMISRSGLREEPNLALLAMVHASKPMKLAMLMNTRSLLIGSLAPLHRLETPNVEVQRPPQAVRWNAGLGGLLPWTATFETRKVLRSYDKRKSN